MGSIRLTTSGLPATTLPEPVEVAFAPRAAGATVGANATNASATVAGSLVGTTAQALWLNNTNASGAYHARIVLWSASGLADVTSLAVGIDNGTATPQVTGTLGGLTQAGGALVRLEPGSANSVYVSQTVGLTQGTTVLDMEVYVADDAAESAYYVMRMRLTIT